MIALYVHPKNSNYLRSHLTAIMALDHSRLGLENKSGRIFCVRQVLILYKILQVWDVQNQPFTLLYITSVVKRYHEALFSSYRPLTECSIDQYFTILQYKLHSFNIQDDRSTRGLLAKPSKKFPKSPIRLAGSHFWQASKSAV